MLAEHVLVSRLMSDGESQAQSRVLIDCATSVFAAHSANGCKTCRYQRHAIVSRDCLSYLIIISRTHSFQANLNTLRPVILIGHALNQTHEWNTLLPQIIPLSSFHSITKQNKTIKSFSYCFAKTYNKTMFSVFLRTHWLLFIQQGILLHKLCPFQLKFSVSKLTSDSMRERISLSH